MMLSRLVFVILLMIWFGVGLGANMKLKQENESLGCETSFWAQIAVVAFAPLLVSGTMTAEALEYQPKSRGDCI